MKHLCVPYILSRLSHQSRSITTAQIRRCSVLPPVTNSHNSQNKDNSERNSFNFSGALGFGAGLIIGACLKSSFDEYHNTLRKSIHLFPVVHAASPFGFNTVASDENANISPPSPTVGKRIVYNFIADVVEKVSDGVVYIEIKDNRRYGRRKMAVAESNGSGFIVSKDGLILTNAHVVSNIPRNASIMVRLHDDKEYNAVVEEIDTHSDLALLRIKCDDLKQIALGHSKDLRPGEFVAALGSPLSLSNTVTVGVVSSVGRASKELGLHGKDIEYIQTDAAITFGNSGGPLVNLDGEVIGINSMTVTSGISFAIPIDHAKEFMKRAEKKRIELAKYPNTPSSNRRRYLGITMLTLNETIIQELQSRGNSGHRIPSDLTNGVFIWRIVVGSPAYQAGLQPGDIITHINNHPLMSSRDVYKLLEGNADLNLVVVRNGQKYSVSVVPDE